MARKSRFPMIWWYVTVDKEYYNFLTCEDCNTYIVKAHTKTGAANYVENVKLWGNVIDIRPATDDEYLDAIRLIP